MKNLTIKNTRKALAYAKHFDAHFYAISANEYTVTLQSKFNPDLLVKISNMGFICDITTPNGFLMYRRGNVTIVLT